LIGMFGVSVQNSRVSHKTIDTPCAIMEELDHRLVGKFAIEPFGFPHQSGNSLGIISFLAQYVNICSIKA
jgi:hypothetical protein